MTIVIPAPSTDEMAALQAAHPKADLEVLTLTHRDKEYNFVLRNCTKAEYQRFVNAKDPMLGLETLVVSCAVKPNAKELQDMALFDSKPSFISKMADVVMELSGQSAVNTAKK